MLGLVLNRKNWKEGQAEPLWCWAFLPPFVCEPDSGLAWFCELIYLSKDMLTWLDYCALQPGP